MNTKVHPIVRFKRHVICRYSGQHGGDEDHGSADDT